MSGYPGGSGQGHYDDGYGRQQGGADSYYQDDQYYDQHGYDDRRDQRNDGYYDES